MVSEEIDSGNVWIWPWFLIWSAAEYRPNSGLPHPKSPEPMAGEVWRRDSSFYALDFLLRYCLYSVSPIITDIPEGGKRLLCLKSTWCLQKHSWEKPWVCPVWPTLFTSPPHTSVAPWSATKATKKAPSATSHRGHGILLEGGSLKGRKL